MIRVTLLRKNHKNRLSWKWEGALCGGEKNSGTVAVLSNEVREMFYLEAFAAFCWYFK